MVASFILIIYFVRKLESNQGMSGGIMWLERVTARGVPEQALID
jgi:hypothetical protein